MCKFLSALVFRNGDIVCDPEHTDSHEDLIQSHNLRDDSIVANRYWVRVEFVPREGSEADLQNWRLTIDESETPDWFDHEAVKQRLVEMVQAHIISGSRGLLLGGWWILAGEAVVNVAKCARIVVMYDSSRIGETYGSSRIGAMYNSSQIGTMYDSSRVERVYNSSRVGAMCDSSQIGAMCDSSQIERVYNSSRVGAVCDSSQIGAMCDSSRVGAMYNSSQIGTMCDSSRVGAMCDSSQIETMRGSSQIERVCDSSRVLNDNRQEK